MNDYQAASNYKRILLDASEVLAAPNKDDKWKLSELEGLINSAFGFDIVKSERELQDE